ncbi:MAG TPA: hypothetical protein VHA82_17770 [Ramlibacter sp.]|uniref:hypothetical protein n=1 Tax=Ramlibacter sp. TaxID=1917967 RepID=UPI002C2D001E|nr:hypothetical protein [Ramlibacter sp.]HVZ45660.1 hypothetical protein [Ramlibacter sp.]
MAALGQSNTSADAADLVQRLVDAVSASPGGDVDLSSAPIAVLGLLTHVDVLLALKEWRLEQEPAREIERIILPELDTLPRHLGTQLLTAFARLPGLLAVATRASGDFVRWEDRRWLLASGMQGEGTGHPPDENTKHKWTRRNRFLICMDQTDKRIRAASKVHQIQYDIPDEHVFHLGSRLRGNAPGLPLQEQSLSGVGLGDRLDIQCHGNSQYVAGQPMQGSGEVKAFDPAALAELLHSKGLRSVGVLKLQGCSVSAGNYLETLSMELTLRGIQVGYLSGFKGNLWNLRTVVRFRGGRHVVDWTKPLRLLCPLLWGTLKGKWVGFLPSLASQQALRGNVKLTFRGTKFYDPQRFGTPS